MRLPRAWPNPARRVRHGRTYIPRRVLLMPRPARPWFRFYVEAMSDRKLRRMTPTQRWIWVAVLAAARQSCRPGWLLVSENEPMDAHDIADLAGVPEREVAKVLPLFEASAMLAFEDECWHVINWADRQYESDDVTARTRKHRSKEQGRNVPTTFPGTPPETESETETENPPSPPSSGRFQGQCFTCGGKGFLAFGSEREQCPTCNRGNVRQLRTEAS